MIKRRSVRDLTEGLKTAAKSVADLADNKDLTKIEIQRICDIEEHLLNLEYCLSYKQETKKIVDRI